MKHIPYCPQRNNRPAKDCLWCATERGEDPLWNIPRLAEAGEALIDLADAKEALRSVL